MTTKTSYIVYLGILSLLLATHFRSSLPEVYGDPTILFFYPEYYYANHLTTIGYTLIIGVAIISLLKERFTKSQICEDTDKEAS